MKEKLKRKFKHYWKHAVVVIFVLAAVAELSGYSIRDFISNDSIDSFSATVIVHGKNGKDDIILKNQGGVYLDLGSDRKEESINEQGEATFKELPIGYLNKEVLISVKHSQPYFPVKRDVKYKIEKNRIIYLEIELKDLGQVQGKVISYETEDPLDSVRVSVQNIATYTDKFGWFELLIPEEKQSKFLKVTFQKEGFIMQSIDNVAPHINKKKPLGVSLEKTNN